MDQSDEELNDLLPLREPTFYILLSLTGGEMHGYGIMKTIEQLSRGKLRLSTGTLYEALARLVDLEWIERVDSPAQVVEPDADQRSKTRKAYRISRLGRRVLRAELNRMQALISTARQRLGEERA
jgi:DNA-binding PadR family transcriptional regulator